MPGFFTQYSACGSKVEFRRIQQAIGLKDELISNLWIKTREKRFNILFKIIQGGLSAGPQPLNYVASIGIWQSFDLSDDTGSALICFHDGHALLHSGLRNIDASFRPGIAESAAIDHGFRHLL